MVFRPSPPVVTGMASVVLLFLGSSPAFAWGDEGHHVVALIADHYLEPSVHAKVQSLLAGDRSRLTATTDIAAEATWADKYRDSDRDTTKLRYYQTRNWHFVDLELDAPDLNTACFGQPPQSTRVVASKGPAADCVVDKIDEFAAELSNRATPKKERLLALQFVLHLVGDIHQPLHAADNHDEGGNRKTVIAPDIPAATLHGDWDTTFVSRLGSDDRQIAQKLIEGITAGQRTAWSAGTAADWAHESFLLAKTHAYGNLPEPAATGEYKLSAAYVADATRITAEQLSKAGVRLAYVLNKSLR